MTATKPGGLLDQYKLLGAVIDSKWATRLDVKVARHIVDRYYPKHGNARASLRYLTTATRGWRTSIIESIRRLTDNGVITVLRKGAGRWPTEFGLNFDFIPKPVSDPEKATSISGPGNTTSSDPEKATSSAISDPGQTTKTYLRDRLTSRSTVDRTDTHAGPPSGRVAATADPARDPKGETKIPFEQLWAAFPRKHERAKARAAYAKLEPNDELHAKLVQRATALAAHYQTTATDKKWWKHLHNWLAEERYLEDLPVPYENAKDAAIARAKSGPRQAKEESSEPGASGLTPKTPRGPHVVEIVGCELATAINNDTAITFHYRIRGGDHDGKEFSHSFALSDSHGGNIEGQAVFRDIREATGVLAPDETTDFHGVVLCADIGKFGRVKYAPAGTT